ncbi:MAG TPA: GGDEF domain-containing protein, partial [Burkholderiaceae bacterium]|nr:GGDEF domain-containing protein [Burkholderiaceae bacterium]
MPHPHEASPTLARQLQQLRLQPDQPPPDAERWQALLEWVDRSFADYERQLALATRGEERAWADTVSEPRELDASDPGAAVWIWQPGDEALRISSGLAELLHLPPGTQTLPLAVWLTCLEDSDRELQCEYLMQAAQQSAQYTGQLRYTPPYGRELRWLRYALQSELPPGAPADALRVTCLVQDITRRMAADTARSATALDALTGLASRSHFFDLAATTRALAEREGRQVGLLCLDIDGLQRFNERYGHEIGDRLLRGVAQRLRASVRLGDQIGRLAGDEFLLLVHPIESVQHLEAIAYKIQAAVAVPMEIGGESISLSLSVGIALHPGDAATLLDLVRAAGRACEAAKARGPGGCMLHEQL